MGSALDWLNNLIQWAGRFVPRWVIVNATEAGIKFVRGSKIVVVQPGIHWWWPASTEMKFYPTVRQSVNLAAQTILTKDGRTVAIGGILIYRVSDIEAILAKTLDADRTIKDVAAGVIHSVCSSKSYEELSDQAGLRKALRHEMRHRLRPFGVKVLDSTLTDFAPCKVLKLLNSQSQD